jgi:D-alanyl-D-alanine carboxypeptidase
MAARPLASSRSNFVLPEKRFAVVALVNADFGGAQDDITDITDLLLPGHPAQPAANLDQQRDALARALFDQLRTGTLDRALLTEDANYYFTPQATGDYHDSLAPLGDPVASPRSASRGCAAASSTATTRSSITTSG